MFTVLHIKDFEVSNFSLWHFRSYNCYLSLDWYMVIV